MDNNYREKRRNRRKKMVAEVHYSDEKNQSFGGCISKDINESGVCIKINKFIPVGAILDLEFKLPLSETTFFVKGEIMWINKSAYNEQWEAGLKIKMDERYAALVQKYISSKNPPV